jgi:NAD(P)-dependent dehydrogenase (short-subunit alcohol dehydrogenase family)
MKDGTMRVVVVGASSGLGRCIAAGLGARGAGLALLARRRDQLEEAAKEASPSGAGAGAVAITCDVTDEASCRESIQRAADELGGIDGLVYAPAVGPLVRMSDMDAATWHRVLATNVVGASLITAAAVPHLTESSGAAVYLSSTSASLTPPWPGLGAYAVSKAALDKLVDAWRAEHPRIGFTRLTVGECIGGEGDSMTQFSAGWDRDLVGEVHPIWAARQYMSGGFVDVDELVATVDHLLSSGSSVCIPNMALIPRPPG